MVSADPRTQLAFDFTEPASVATTHPSETAAITTRLPFCAYDPLEPSAPSTVTSSTQTSRNASIVSVVSRALHPSLERSWTPGEPAISATFQARNEKTLE